MCHQITDVWSDRFSISSIQLANLGGNYRVRVVDVTTLVSLGRRATLFNYAAAGTMRVS